MKVLFSKFLMISLMVAGCALPGLPSGAMAQNDNYEPNDDPVSASTSLAAGVWLAAVNGPGQIIDGDEDWYRIEVPQGQEKIVITCHFTDADGDLDVWLFDATGQEPEVAYSDSQTDNEQITYCGVTTGTYYIKVFSWDPIPSPGISYDLHWTTLSNCDDDCFEENDDPELDPLEDLSSQAGVWLSEIGASDPTCLNSTPLQADDDWYFVFLPPGQQQLTIDCSFAHDEGDIDIRLYDVNLADIARSTSFTDNETISTCLDDGGEYFIRVHNANAGNAYDLRWSTTPGCGPWQACGAVDLGSDWFWLDWFGYFNLALDPWVYHQEHKFLYPFGDDCAGLVFWDSEMGAFWWTSASVYPHIYRFADEEWLWYLPDSVNPRWFVILSSGVWESYPPAP